MTWHVTLSCFGDSYPACFGSFTGFFSPSSPESLQDSGACSTKADVCSVTHLSCFTSCKTLHLLSRPHLCSARLPCVSSLKVPSSTTRCKVKGDCQKTFPTCYSILLTRIEPLSLPTWTLHNILLLWKHTVWHAGLETSKKGAWATKSNNLDHSFLSSCTCYCKFWLVVTFSKCFLWLHDQEEGSRCSSRWIEL